MTAKGPHTSAGVIPEKPGGARFFRRIATRVYKNDRKEVVMSEKITLSDAERSALLWLKAQRSGANGACVEIASTAGKIAVRDSKDPDGPILVYTPTEFSAFLEGTRNGEFDHLVY
jgi:hypothetical protein